MKSKCLSLANLECIRELGTIFFCFSSMLLTDFEGRGSYGRVFAVRHKKGYAIAERKSPNNVYALKAQRIVNTKNDEDAVSLIKFSASRLR